ncbi:MAG: thioredoxin domain-containing protein [Anaerolineales bacterium]|nr:thioredoxin domain-containing protein [Anaerolineales bacterium]
MLEKFPLLEAEYIETGKIKFVVHSFNLGSPEIALAAEAAWCAADQNKFFEYQHALYENQGTGWNATNLADLAGRTGLDQSALSQCLSNGTHRADVENARQAAFNRGVTSTPTFFVNAQRIQGNVSYEEFKQVIDQELTKAQ